VIPERFGHGSAGADYVAASEICRSRHSLVYPPKNVESIKVRSLLHHDCPDAPGYDAHLAQLRAVLRRA